MIIKHEKFIEVSKMQAFEITTQASYSDMMNMWEESFNKVHQIYNSFIDDKNYLPILLQSAKQSNFFQNFYSIMTCPFSFVTNQMKEKSASLTATILKQYSKTQPCEEVTKNYLSILYNFKINYRVKRFFISSAALSKHHWRQSIGFLYEKSILAVLALVQKLQKNNVQGLYLQEINASCFQTPYLIKVEWPADRDEIFGTVTIIGKVLTQKLEFSSSKYEIQLATLFCKFTHHIVQSQFFEAKAQILVDLLEFWKEFLIRDFQIQDLYALQSTQEEEKEEERNKVLNQISGWPIIYQWLLKIIFHQSPVLDGNHNIYNLFKLRQLTYGQTYYILKQKAAIILAELIITDQQRKGTASQKYCMQIRWSIIHSLKWLVSQTHTLGKHQELACIDLMDVFFAVLIQEHFLDIEQQRDLILNVLLPMLEQQFPNVLYQYQEDIQEYEQCIQDLFLSQQQHTILAKATKILETLVVQYLESEEILFGNIVDSLKANKALILKQKHQFGRPFTLMTNTTCFFLISLFWYKSIKRKQLVATLNNIFASNYISQLQEIEVALLYELFCEKEIEAFESSPFISQLINAGLNTLVSSSLKVCASKMLYHLSQRYFTREHVVMFMNRYNMLGNSRYKPMFLKKLINKRCQLFESEEDFILIIENCKNLIEMELELVNCAQQLSSEFSTRWLYQDLLICEEIASKPSIWQKSQKISSALWSIFNMLKEFQKINFDNQCMQLAIHLLKPLNFFPLDIMEIIEKVRIVFQSNKYEGDVYYKFFQMVHKKCSQTQKEILNSIQQSIVQGICVMVIFPIGDQEAFLNIQEAVTLSNSLWILQSMLIRGKMTSIKDFFLQIKVLVEKFSECRPRLSQFPSVQARYINFIVTASKSLQIEIDFNLIKELAQQGKFKDYQSKILIIQLTSILQRISAEDKSKLWLIIKFLLKTEVEREKSKKADQHERKFRNLVQAIDPPFPLGLGLLQVLQRYVQEFKNLDFKAYQTSLNQLSEADYSEICSLLKMNLKLRKLIKLDNLKGKQGSLGTSQVNQVNRQLVFNDEEAESIYLMQRLKLRSSPFEIMESQNAFSDEQDRQLVKSRLKLQKYRGHRNNHKKNAIQRKFLSNFNDQ